MIDGYTKAGPDIQENLPDYFDCMNLNISNLEPKHLATYLCQFIQENERSSYNFITHYMPSDSDAKKELDIKMTLYNVIQSSV